MKTPLLLGLVVLTLSQNFATIKPDHPIPSPYQECTKEGCTTKQGAVTIDSAWRWLHYVNNQDSCRKG
jgi:cellulose 1,4-beta-cellobiosidase